MTCNFVVSARSISAFMRITADSSPQATDQPASAWMVPTQLRTTGYSGFMKRLSTAAAFLICVVFIQGSSVAVAQNAARTIEIHAKRFSFSPSEITLKRGETVKLIVSSEDVKHSLFIPDLQVNAEATKDHPAR